ncbi:hypothetical protein PIIN_07576 [Serendipita indica DSM 11827]|uniref:Uncharacterized protein n=1 Tax=Serendipita indica (strain DSM 11827) TaxID=1109443 RepID=G4TQN0_SERID|nr:hypothetical protein PIIN_07576 [Serendipita indica DSM 11827]
MASLAVAVYSMSAPAAQDAAANTVECLPSVLEEGEWGERHTANSFIVRDSVIEEGDSRPNNALSDERLDAIEEEFGVPDHPLDETDVFHLIKAHKLQLSTSAELQDKYKSDGLAKLLVIVQTLWSINQCITRKSVKFHSPNSRSLHVYIL